MLNLLFNINFFKTIFRLVPKVKKSIQVKVMTLTFYFCLKILFLKSKSNVKKYIENQVNFDQSQFDFGHFQLTFDEK